MRNLLPILFLAGAIGACSSPTPAPAPNIAADTRVSLDQAGLNDVAVDVENATVKISGQVQSEAQKAQAESIAKSKAGTLTVVNEVAVRPPGMEGDAAKVANAVDDAIEQSIKASLVQARIDDGVDIDVKEGVVTLTGTVNTAAIRTRVASLAGEAGNVKQVVNELKIKS